MKTADLMVEHAIFCEVKHVSPSCRVFAAYVKQGPFAMPLGALTYDKTFECVELVYVDEPFRRKGLATRLLEYAREVTGEPLDFDGGDRSPMGEELSKAWGMRCQGRARKLDQGDANAIGARLMVALWDAYPAAVLGEDAILRVE